MANLDVVIQTAAFDPGELQQQLIGQSTAIGGVVTFTGYVRNANEGDEVSVLQLEHYPGMTERVIQETLENAAQRWPLLAAQVVHRVGELVPGDPIVWVGISAKHRAAAYAACEFAMDFLKTEAPFWKKERTADGERWLDQRSVDTERTARW